MKRLAQAMLTIGLLWAIPVRVAGEQADVQPVDVRLAAATDARVVSGTVITEKHEVVPGVVVITQFASGTAQASTDELGNFRFSVPSGPFALHAAGAYLTSEDKSVSQEALGMVQHHEQPKVAKTDLYHSRRLARFQRLATLSPHQRGHS